MITITIDTYSMISIETEIGYHTSFMFEYHNSLITRSLLPAEDSSKSWQMWRFH